MSIDKKKTLEELEAEMDALTGRLSSLSTELQEARRRQAHVPTEQEQHQALLRKMVGRKIRITLKDAPLDGMEAVITGPRGKSKKPMHWWFTTATGVKAHKAKTSFKLLPLEEAQPVIDIAIRTPVSRVIESSWQPQHVSTTATSFPIDVTDDLFKSSNRRSESMPLLN